MRQLFLFFFLTTILPAGGCGTPESKQTEQGPDSLSQMQQETGELILTKPDTVNSKRTYSNNRFKNVTVEQVAPHQFRISGRAQVFEATFSWVIEDGHNELQKGFEMTDAGAPEWGKFEFIVDATKERTNSTLHLILFESSPKDGSRQYELPILLY